MKNEMLKSQMDAIEEPAEVTTVNIDTDIESIVDLIWDELIH